MSEFQRMVSRFNTAMKASGDAPLRISLILEEAKEVADAIKKEDAVELIDGLCDLLYVTYGAADLFGFILDTEDDEAQDILAKPLGWGEIQGSLADFSQAVSDTCENIRKFAAGDVHGAHFAADSLTELAGGCWLMAAEGLGLDLRPFFKEVHRTNMLKLTGPKRADGKQLKPEGWKPPRIAAMLDFLRTQNRLECDCKVSDGPIKDNQGGERCVGCAAFLTDAP